MGLNVLKPAVPHYSQLLKNDGNDARRCGAAGRLGGNGQAWANPAEKSAAIFSEPKPAVKNWRAGREG